MYTDVPRCITEKDRSMNEIELYRFAGGLSANELKDLESSVNGIIAQKNDGNNLESKPQSGPSPPLEVTEV